MEEGEDGRARFIRTFRAQLNRGLAEATRQGFVNGRTETIDGQTVVLCNRGRRNIGGLDEVQLTYIGLSGAPIPPRAQRPRRPGDEEWSLSGSLEDVPEDEDFYNADGQLVDIDTLNIITGTLRMPRLVLVWKKWLTPIYGVSLSDPRPLPRSKAAALALAISYSSGPSGEGGGGPRMGCTLDSSTAGKKWLCVDIAVEADGALLCRTARFQHRNDDWNASAYPPS